MICRNVEKNDEMKMTATEGRCFVPAGFLNVLMNCQWQSLLCQVEDGVLNMFGEEMEEEAQRSPQYTVQLRGSEVRDGPDTDRSYRITLSTLGDQAAVLEVS